MSRDTFEYLLAGLRRELEDSLERLAKTGAAPEYLAYYRNHFDAFVSDLRRALDPVGPDGYNVAIQAWNVAFIARIWPILRSLRAGETMRDTLGEQNRDVSTTAAIQRERCLTLAAGMKNPTAESIRNLYRTRFTNEPLPGTRTISRYLHSR